MSKLLFLVAIIMLPLGCKTRGKTPPPAQLDTPLTVRYFGRDGKTVLELLEASHPVAKKTSSMGSFVETIDGVKNRSERFWIYYVNGKQPNVACDRYLTTERDTIEWRFEAKHKEVK